MKNKPEAIKTARLTLRSITEEDWQDRRALLYDEQIKYRGRKHRCVYFEISK